MVVESVLDKFRSSEKLKKRTEKKIEEALGGYSFSKLSGGRLFNYIALGKSIGLELNVADKKHLGNTIKKIATEDYLDAYRVLEKILSGIYNTGVPVIDSDAWFRPQNGYELVEHFAKKEGIYKLEFSSDEERKKVLKRVNRFSEESKDNNDFQGYGQSPINMQVLELQDLNLMACIRKKDIFSAVVKYLERYSRVIMPSPEDVEKLKRDTGYGSVESFKAICKDANHCMMLAKRDVYEEICDLGSNNVCLDRATSLSMFDLAGLKMVANKRDIHKIDGFIGNQVNKNVLKVLMQAENNLATGKKDKSITYGFNGQYERTFVEGKFQPWFAFFEGEYGLRSHEIDYKPKLNRRVLDFIQKRVEGSDVATNLCEGFQIPTKDLENKIRENLVF